MSDFPDYEAAAQSIKDAWLIDDRSTATFISLLKDAISAALGDEVLYRIDLRVVAGFVGEGTPKGWVKSLVNDKALVQMWPKGELT